MIFMMFLMIVGGTAVTTTMMDYKSRVNESYRVENLYGAESGLEIAYDILLKASDYAINEAIEVTNARLATESNNRSTDPVDLNVLFKSTYFKALFDSGYKHEPNQYVEDGLVSYLLTNLVYPIVNDVSQLTFKSSDFNPKDKEIKIEVELLDESGQIMTDLVANQTKFKVKVTSIFKSDEDNTQMSVNERKVSRIFEFHIPNYTQYLVDIYPVFNGKALTVDGNLTIAGNDTNKVKLDVTGDVWIGGNRCVNQLENCSTIVNDVTYEKYSNGILIDKADFTLNGVLATDETLAIYDKAIVLLNGNVYGRNIYIGRKNVAATSDDVRLEVIGKNDTKYDVVLSNDLTINGSPNFTKASSVVIDKFYGFSNKNVTDQDIPLDNTQQLSKESSSILVNAEGASVELTDEAYIGGLAFIDVADSSGNKYQTGESVAIKPNYLAYTQVVEEYASGLTFRYYNPLMLVESLPEGVSKSDYFVKVSEGNLLTMDAGGIKLPTNLYSAGAIVSVNGVQGTTGQTEVGELIRVAKEKDYKLSVYDMGGVTDSNILKRTVANQIIWTAKGFETPVTQTDIGTIVLNGDKNLKVIISKHAGQVYVQIGSSERQQIKDNYLFLVTKGDVEVQGDVELTGNLIVGGHLDIKQANSKVNLKYDEVFMKNILATNAELFNGLFIDSGKVSTSIELTETPDYSATAIISKGRWELVK